MPQANPRNVVSADCRATFVALLVLAGCLACGCSGPDNAAGNRGSAADELLDFPFQPAPWTRQGNKAAVEKMYAEHRGQFGDDPDMLVRPGLLANRRQQWVRVWGEATGLKAEDPAEFFLVAQSSLHEYEAIAVSFAQPSDIREALEFIGLKVGRPINPRQRHFWPKGERVVVTYEWPEIDLDARSGDEPARHSARAEELQINVQKNQPLTADGFVFVGSYWTEPDGPGERLLAADVQQPRCILPNYNEPTTLLDIPRQVAQGDVYSHQCVNPEKRLVAPQPVQVVFEPEYKDGKRRIKDLLLEAGVRPSTTGGQLGDLQFVLSDERGERIVDGKSIAHVLAAVPDLIAAGHDPFVNVRVGDRLQLEAVRQMYTVLASVETDNGIRIEPPPDGEFFFRAFLPDAQARQRPGSVASKRWELRLSDDGDATTGTLWKIDDSTGQFSAAGEPEARFEVQSAADVSAALAEAGDEHHALLIFAPPDLGYGALTALVAPLLTVDRVAFVLLPDSPQAEDAKGGKEP